MMIHVAFYSTAQNQTVFNWWVIPASLCEELWRQREEGGGGVLWNRGYCSSDWECAQLCVMEQQEGQKRPWPLACDPRPTLLQLPVYTSVSDCKWLWVKEQGPDNPRCSMLLRAGFLEVNSEWKTNQRLKINELCISTLSRFGFEGQNNDDVTAVSPWLAEPETFGSHRQWFQRHLQV